MEDKQDEQVGIRAPVDFLLEDSEALS